MAKPDAGRAVLDGNAVRTQRTRARVLAASLAAFNAQGEANVTTGMIAAALDMSPGNLYYHFRNKDAIIEELFSRFEERITVEPRPTRDAATAIEDLWLYLHLMFEGIWDYRFLYRNLDDLLARNRVLRNRFARIVERKLEIVEALCDALAAAGALRATPGEIRTLARNVLVVATYWPSFQRLRSRGSSRDDSSARVVAEGAHQVLALLAPYLVGAARRHLEAIGLRYLD